MFEPIAEAPAIDVTFDVRDDVRPGQDPDRYSKKLHGYHRLLWSKPLPDGRDFNLTSGPAGTLVCGEVSLSSDGFVATFFARKKLAGIIDQVRNEAQAFCKLGYTVGGFVMFPSRQIGRKQTINGARGCNAAISDRPDLTVECIRRHYAREVSPLSEVLDRYEDFFALFTDFAGYVRFWLLDDLVDEVGNVRFWMPFDDFRGPAVPTDVAVYRAYMAHGVEFLNARNARMLDATR